MSDLDAASRLSQRAQGWATPLVVRDSSPAFRVTFVTTSHDHSQGGTFCPNLGNIATEAERIIHQPDYHGAATTAAAYIRESILDPNAYIVPGPAYRDANGRSLMPADFGERLTSAELDDLVAFLLTRR